MTERAQSDADDAYLAADFIKKNLGELRAGEEPDEAMRKYIAKKARVILRWAARKR